MKKLILLVAVSFLLFSCNQNDDLFVGEIKTESIKQSSRLNSNENIKLYSAWSSYSAKYGYKQQTKKFEVEIRNLGYDKTVEVLHQMEDGSWKLFPLSYSFSISNNSEIWSADINLNYWETDEKFGEKFAVKYTINGNEYWDNNDSNDYQLSDLSGRFLADEVNVRLYSGRLYNSYYNNSKSFVLDVDVKNLAYDKQVQVVYSYDGWATNQTANLSFSQYHTVGLAQVLRSPNSFNIEKWTARINVPEDTQKIEYAIVYKVNGQEYWDNNFGQNYITK